MPDVTLVPVVVPVSEDSLGLVVKQDFEKVNQHDRQYTAEMKNK